MICPQISKPNEAIMCSDGLVYYAGSSPKNENRCAWWDSDRECCGMLPMQNKSSEWARNRIAELEHKLAKMKE